MPGGRRCKNPTKVKKIYHCRQDDMFVVDSGIKFLLGCTEEEHNMHQQSTSFYEHVLPGSLQTTVALSTIAAIGLIRCVKFNEEELMKRIAFNSHIYSISGCGRRIVNPEYTGGADVVMPACSFRCQITLEVVGEDPDKRYKIKVFRNGVVHIPGIVRVDMRDSIVPLQHVCQFMRLALGGSGEIAPEYVKAIMRNYGCVLRDPKTGIVIHALKKCILIEQGLPLVPIGTIAAICRSLEARIGKRQTFMFLQYVKWAFMPIKKPRCNRQKTSGILVKFDRYSEPNIKDLTIRILTSGKITFNGSNSEVEVLNSYWWLNFIFAKYYEEVIFDPSRDRARMHPPSHLLTFA